MDSQLDTLDRRYCLCKQQQSISPCENRYSFFIDLHFVRKELKDMFQYGWSRKYVVNLMLFKV